MTDFIGPTFLVLVISWITVGKIIINIKYLFNYYIGYNIHGYIPNVY